MMENSERIFDSTIKHIVRWSILYLVAVVVFVLFIILYPMEAKKEVVPFLGQIADFIGGLLNPFLAFINICVFVLLTVQIQKLSDASDAKNLATTKKIAIMSLQHDELKHYIETMDNALAKWEVKPFDGMELVGIIDQYKALRRRMSFVFPDFSGSEVDEKMISALLLGLEHFARGRKEDGGMSAIRIRYMHATIIVELGKQIVA